MFNYFSIAGLCIGVINLGLAILISLSPRTKLQKVWSLVNYSISLWGFGMFISGSTKSHELAFIGWRVFNVGIILISVIYYHVIHLFCNLRSNKFLIYSYVQAAVFIIFAIFTNLLFGDKLFFSFNQFYYFRASVFHHMLMINFSIIVGKSFYELYKHIQKTKGILNIQGKYLFLAMFFGFGGGLNTAPAAWGFNIYPYGQILVCFYGAVATYAILKYQLMDVRVAVTRLGIFILVYSLVLGIPFGFAISGKTWLNNFLGENWFWVPMLILLMFATAGPFIYIYFQRRAEEAFLQEEQRTQDLLMQASYGMNTIHNLQKLLDLIVTIVVKTLRVDSGRIFLLNRNADKYELKVPIENNGLIFQQNDPLVEQLKNKQYPIVYDEMKVVSEMNGEAGLKEVENKMRELSAHMIVPITLKDSLIGFLALGERDSKDMYSRGLLNALSVLGRNAGLAIDRCNYIETETKRLEEESLKERIVSLDHMASSMAHEIDNPMVGVHSSLEYIRNILMRDPRVYIHEAVKEEWDETINRGLHCAERVSGMVKAILDYSRMGKGELKPVVIKEAVEGFQQLIGPEKKTEKVHLVVELEDNLPPILGDRIKLEQIFVNFVRNAIHAVKHKEQEERNVTLRIYKKDYKTIRVECIDNGYGIEKKLLNDMFLANTTTKGSSEGTGMGLYIVRQTVTTFGGRVWAESEGKGKGARLIAELPTYDGDRIAKIDTLKPKKEEKNGKDGQSKNQSPGA